MYVGCYASLSRYTVSVCHPDRSRREQRDRGGVGSFTARYIFDMLVYYEEFSRPIAARIPEKEIKGWRREKKLTLIMAANPDWADLSLEWREDRGWNLEPETRMRLRPSNKES